MGKPHKKLDVWQTSMKTALIIYKLTTRFPEEEKFGLVSQMRRAAVSVPSNIGEGAGRQGKREFRNFLSVAQGSLSELDTQSELALLLGYCNKSEIEETDSQLVRIDKMLTGLIRSLSKGGEDKSKRIRAYWFSLFPGERSYALRLATYGFVGLFEKRSRALRLTVFVRDF